MEPATIISRRSTTEPKSGKMWLYMCDNGKEYGTKELAELSGTTPECLYSKYSRRDKGKPFILTPSKKYQKRDLAAKKQEEPTAWKGLVKQPAKVKKGMSCEEISSRLKKFNASQEKKGNTTTSTFIHMTGYEPVLFADTVGEFKEHKQARRKRDATIYRPRKKLEDGVLTEGAETES